MLDTKGQKLAQFVWDNMSNEVAYVETRMAEVQEKLTSKDKLVADEGSITYCVDKIVNCNWASPPTPSP